MHNALMHRAVKSCINFSVSFQFFDFPVLVTKHMLGGIPREHVHGGKIANDASQGENDSWPRLGLVEVEHANEGKEATNAQEEPCPNRMLWPIVPWIAVSVHYLLASMCFRENSVAARLIALQTLALLES